MQHAGTPLLLPPADYPPYRLPRIRPERWYSIQQVSSHYGTGDDYWRRKAEQWYKEGRQGVIFKREKRPGRKRHHTFVRLRGDLLLAWENE